MVRSRSRPMACAMSVVTRRSRMARISSTAPSGRALGEIRTAARIAA
jgi:hypothetical protein